MSHGKDDISFWGNFCSGTMFKRNQGRLVRRLTAIAIAAIALIGCWLLSIWLETNTSLSEVWGPGPQLLAAVLAALGLWLAFRTINYPRFANFLISVEAEMDKVSWADWDYLKRATAVVLCTMLFLGAVLWIYDFFWFRLFTLIHILDADALQGVSVPEDLPAGPE